MSVKVSVAGDRSNVVLAIDNYFIVDSWLAVLQAFKRRC